MHSNRQSALDQTRRLSSREARLAKAASDSTRTRRPLIGSHRSRTFRFVFIAVMVVIAGSIFVSCASALSKDTVVATVTKTDRVCSTGTDGAQDCKYLVFTDKGTFEVTDALICTQRWNSSDVYGRIIEGKTYTIKTCGFRLPFFSTYPNIITAEEVTP